MSAVNLKPQEKLKSYKDKDGKKYDIYLGAPSLVTGKVPNPIIATHLNENERNKLQEDGKNTVDGTMFTVLDKNGVVHMSYASSDNSDSASGISGNVPFTVKYIDEEYKSIDEIPHGAIKNELEDAVLDKYVKDNPKINDNVDDLVDKAKKVIDYYDNHYYNNTDTSNMSKSEIIALANTVIEENRYNTIGVGNTDVHPEIKEYEKSISSAFGEGSNYNKSKDKLYRDIIKSDRGKYSLTYVQTSNPGESAAVNISTPKINIENLNTDELKYSNLKANVYKYDEHGMPVANVEDYHSDPKLFTNAVYKSKGNNLISARSNNESGSIIYQENGKELAETGHNNVDIDTDAMTQNVENDYLRDKKLADDGLNDRNAGFANNTTDNDVNKYESPNSETYYMHLRANSSIVDTGISDLTSYIFHPSATLGINGMPTSFLPTTDPPAWDGASAGLGYNYMEHYIKYGQFVSFRPVVATFKGIVSSIYENLKDANVQGAIKALQGGEWASLEPRVVEYWEQVARIMNSAIYLMGIGDDIIEFSIGAINIGSSTVNQLKKDGFTINGGWNRSKLSGMTPMAWWAMGLAFREVVGNGVPMDYSESINGLRFSKEAGGLSTSGIVSFLSDGPISDSIRVSNNVDDHALTKKIKQLTESTELVKDMLGNKTTGSSAWTDFFIGEYIAPKVWKSSDTSNDYEINFRFSTDNPTPVSVLTRVIFPMVQLLALALPEGTGAMQYSPWLVQAYSAGVINIDYGMITSIRVSKESSNTMNDFGQPSDIKVSITLTDLRPELYQIKPYWWSSASYSSHSINRAMATLTGQNISTIGIEEKKKVLADIKAANMFQKYSLIRYKGRLWAYRIASKLGYGINRIGYNISNMYTAGRYLISGIFSDNVRR